MKRNDLNMGRGLSSSTGFLELVELPVLCGETEFAALPL